MAKESAKPSLLQESLARELPSDPIIVIDLATIYTPNFLLFSTLSSTAPPPFHHHHTNNTQLPSHNHIFLFYADSE